MTKNANPFATVPQLDSAAIDTWLDRIIAANIVPMIYGAAGIGKSSLAAEWASKNNYALLDIRLAQLLPEHIAGIQYPSDDRTRVLTLKPALIGQIEALHAATGKHVLVLLDELTLTSQETLSASLEFLRDRRIGPHKIPDYVRMIAAGNRPQDTSAAFVLDPPVRNRLASVVFAPSRDDVAKLMVKLHPGNDLAAAAADFIRSPMADKLILNNEPGDDAAFATPRSLDESLRAIGNTVAEVSRLSADRVAMMIAESLCGVAFAAAFAAYCKQRARMASTAAILADVDGAVKRYGVPDSPEAATTQFAGLLSEVKARGADNRVVQSMCDYFDRCNREHLRLWGQTLSGADMEMIGRTLRGQRLLSDANIIAPSATGARRTR